MKSRAVYPYAIITALLFAIGLQAAPTVPADVSLMLVDLKYNEQQGVKLCEVQPVIMSAFRGYDCATGDRGGVAYNVSHLLSKYFKKLWYKEGEMRDPHMQSEFSSEGYYGFENLDSLQKAKKFRKVAYKKPWDKGYLKAYKGAIYLRARSMPSLEKFREKNPGIVVIGASTFSHSWDKLSTAKLLESDDELKSLRPDWACFKKGYSLNLRKRVLAKIDSEKLVIKPLRGTKGHGVIIIDRKDLGATLRRLFKDKEALAEDSDECYSWWAKDRSSTFLVEEYVPSVTIYPRHLDGAPYDGTMRVVFALIHQRGDYKVKFLGYYWKLPEAPLDSGEDLNAIHKSAGLAPYFAYVDSETKSEVKTILKKKLPLLHRHLVLDK